MSRVLFACLQNQNAGPSQMSAALFAQAAAGCHLARSEGTMPADRAPPEVITVMDEVGLDLRDRRLAEFGHGRSRSAAEPEHERSP